MDFRLLGPLEALDGERPVELGGGKQRGLLAVLLLHANRVVPRPVLVEALWGRSPPATAEAAIHVYVSRLRKALPPGRLQTRPPGYLLRVEEGELDLARFEDLAARGRSALARDPAAAAALLHEALALWRGTPLADVDLPPEAHRLEELRDAVLEDRIDADLALGRHAELVAELEGLVERNPLRERIRGQLMLALYRAGRQAEALEQYRSARAALRDELGIEPDPELRELHGAILRQERGLALAEPEPERAAAGILFAILTPATGDEEDPALVRDLLERALRVATDALAAAGARVRVGLAGALLGRLEPDGERLLAAALELRRRLDDAFEGSVRARIGVELGEVLTGGETVTGPPVAVASRLAGSARPGEILVGPAAAEDAKGAFELRASGDAHELVDGA